MEFGEGLAGVGGTADLPLLAAVLSKHALQFGTAWPDIRSVHYAVRRRAFRIPPDEELSKAHHAPWMASYESE